MSVIIQERSATVWDAFLGTIVAVVVVLASHGSWYALCAMAMGTLLLFVVCEALYLTLRVFRPEAASFQRQRRLCESALGDAGVIPENVLWMLVSTMSMPGAVISRFAGLLKYLIVPSRWLELNFERFLVNEYEASREDLEQLRPHLNAGRVPRLILSVYK